MRAPKPKSIEALAAEESALAVKKGWVVFRRTAWVGTCALLALGWSFFGLGRLTQGSVLVVTGLVLVGLLTGATSCFRGRPVTWAASALTGLAAAFLFVFHRSPGFQWGSDPSFYLAVIEGRVPAPFASPLSYLFARSALSILPRNVSADLPLVSALFMGAAVFLLILTALEEGWDRGMEARLFAYAAPTVFVLALPLWIFATRASGLPGALGLLLCLALYRLTQEAIPTRGAFLLSGLLFSVHPAWGVLGLLLLFRRPGDALRGFPDGVYSLGLGLSPYLWLVLRAGHSLGDWGGQHPWDAVLHSWNDLLTDHLAAERSLPDALRVLGPSLGVGGALLSVLGWKAPRAAGSFLRILAAGLGSLFFYSRSGDMPGITAAYLPAGMALWWVSLYQDAFAQKGNGSRLLRVLSWVSLASALTVGCLSSERNLRVPTAAPQRHIENLLVNSGDSSKSPCLLFCTGRFESEGTALELLLRPRSNVQPIALDHLGDRWYLEGIIRFRPDILLSVAEGGRERVFRDMVRLNLDRFRIEWADSVWDPVTAQSGPERGFRSVPRVLTQRLLAPGDSMPWEDPSTAYDLSEIMEESRLKGGPARVFLDRYSVGAYAWGLAQSRAGRYPTAVRGFERALSLDPSYTEPKTALERLYSEKSMVEAARLQFERTARGNPARLLALDKILSSGRLSASERSERLIEKSKLTEDLYDALHHLGIIYTRLGRYDDSRKVLENAVKWKPDGVATQMELAKLFLRMGNRTKAQTAFRAVLLADPVNKEAQTELWKLLNRP